MTVVGGLSLGAPLEHRHTCSRAGCRAEAAWALIWRNPKIHTADRRKTWLACDAHREVLASFLSDRSFPLEVVAVEDMASPDDISSGNTSSSKPSSSKHSSSSTSNTSAVGEPNE